MNPFVQGEGAVGPLPCSFAFYSKYLLNSYFKILDLTKLFIADAPMKKKSKHFVLHHLRALRKMGPITADGRKGFK